MWPQIKEAHFYENSLNSYQGTLHHIALYNVVKFLHVKLNKNPYDCVIKFFLSKAHESTDGRTDGRRTLRRDVNAFRN